MNDPKENDKFNPKFKLIIVRFNIIFESNISIYLQSKGKEKDKIYKKTMVFILILYIIIYNLNSYEKCILFFKINSFSTIKLLKRMLKAFKIEDDDIIDIDYITLDHFMMNLCFDEIKAKIYSYENEELIQMYLNEVYGEFMKIFPSTNERFKEDEKYNNFIKNIIELKLDKFIKSLKKEKSDIFCRNLIPILLSHPGFDFISFYTYIIKKHIEIIRKEYNNELTSLFRADDFTNDLIKNIIMIFGNDSFIKSFYLILPKEYLSNNEIEFDLDTFENFLQKFLKQLDKTLPFILRVLLKIIYNCIKNMSENDDSYNVLSTVLIFNFFISPTTLDIFDISLVKYKSLRQLTRILRNIFFGKEFDLNDKLSYFNKKVKIFHKFINEQFNSLLEGIDIEKDKEKINNKINNILVKVTKDKDKTVTNRKIILPLFCYQFYWENIVNSVKDIPEIMKDL